MGACTHTKGEGRFSTVMVGGAWHEGNGFRICRLCGKALGHNAYMAVIAHVRSARRRHADKTKGV